LDDVDMLMEKTRKVMSEKFESLVKEVDKQWHCTKYVIVTAAAAVIVIVVVCVGEGGAFVQCNNI
jgi:hypothetical protein